MSDRALSILLFLSLYLKKNMLMKVKLHFLLVLIVLIFNTYLQSFAKNLYVDGSTGNDSWNGESPVWTSGNNGPVKTIQKAVDLSVINDQIFVAPGIYRENLSINHTLNLTGSGNGSDSTKNTILLSQNYGNGTGVNISISGSSTGLPSKISQMRISGYLTGVILSRDVVYQELVVTDNYYGFSNGGNNYLRDLQLLKCIVTYNKTAGLQINHACNVIAFIIDSCEFSDNFGGIYAYCDNPSTSNIIDFLLKNTSFKRNKQKGIYVEKLENSIFENLYFDSCGIDNSYSWNAGIDINLKFNNYENISIINSEFYYCGTGGASHSGCAMVIKARDDGAVYGANPATLTNVKVKGIIIKYCQNGIIFGEPGKNNFGPEKISVHESQIIYCRNRNIISNIRSEVVMHNNCWLSTNGPSVTDTSLNNSGKILIYTWIKNTIDRQSRIGFQSDSIVWFEKNSGSLQNAIDVTPYAWTLFIPDRHYKGSFHVRSKIYFSPENIVSIESLHLDALSELELINNDLYISDSLFMHKNSYFSTGNQWQVELSDSCLIKEDSGFVVQGRIRTFRNLSGSPTIEDFGGIGLTLKANVNSSFPYNNVVVIRSTGKAAEDYSKKLLRTYEILTHRNCGWKAELSFAYDQSEKQPLVSDTALQLMRSYDNGKKWILSGGQHDTVLNIINIGNADYLQAVWAFTDSTGKIFPPGLAISSELNHIDCNGNKNGSIKVAINGGFPPYHYQWSTGDTVATLDSLTAGIYRLTVSDTGGCSAIDSFEVLEPLPLSHSFAVQPVRCFGESNGKAEIFISGGTPPYQILWKDLEKTAKIINKPAGSYFVTVKDTHLCRFTDTVLITQPEKYVFNEKIHHISCYGKNDGRIELNPQGGTPPYLIFWSTGQSGNSISHLKPGTYDFSIFDSFFCPGGDTFTILEPAPLKVSIQVTHLKCFGEPSGKSEALVSGGTPPYHYLWNGKDTGQTIEKCHAGKYYLMITDENQCVITDSAEILQPQKISFSFQVVHDTNHKCIGRIQANVSGGTPPYLAEWDDPNQQKGFSATGLCSGIYTLSITDSNQCKADSSAEVLQITNPGILLPPSSALSVYPNPCRDEIYLTSEFDFHTITLYDTKGQKVLEFKNCPRKYRIDVSKLISGIYFLCVMTETSGYFVKVMKK